MSRPILIDANAYLDFYRNSRMSDVFPLLQTLRHRISVSRQMADEVQRNKLAVAIEYWSRFGELAQFQIPSLKGLDEASDVLFPKDVLNKIKADVGRLRDTIKAADQLRQKAIGISRSILSDIDGVRGKVLTAIAESSDPASVALAKLWEDAREANADEVSRARLRRERGNPPGKKTDTLGDQLTWEQFLSDVGETDAVWLISRDDDYFDTSCGNRFLNPS